MPANVPAHDNRRREVAAQQRERMRQRLVEAAMLVFAEKGIEARVIDDVIAAAKVSRGTFYNYFRTNQDLVASIAEHLSDELMRLVESRVGLLEDPVQRLADGLRLYLHVARTYPHFSRFVCMTGLGAASSHNLIFQYVPRHLKASMESGRLQRLDVGVAMDVILGIGIGAMFRLAYGEPAGDYPERIVERILVGLGAGSERAKELVSAKLDGITPPAGSFLCRTFERYKASLD